MVRNKRLLRRIGEATSEHNAVIARCWNEADSGAEAKGKQRAMTASPAGGSKVFELRTLSRHPSDHTLAAYVGRNVYGSLLIANPSSDC